MLMPFPQEHIFLSRPLRDAEIVGANLDQEGRQRAEHNIERGEGRFRDLPDEHQHAQNPKKADKDLENTYILAYFHGISNRRPDSYFRIS